MNISSIQKRKFLNNIYKLYYSSGTAPSEDEIRRAFNQFFSVNKFGEPIKLDLDPIQGRSTTDVSALNELMAYSLLNMEVLYDCVMENNQQIFSVVSALNSKLDSLRAKRKELESKIDQLMFSISNTDGFFYSYLENFSTISQIDMNLTNAFIDTVNNNVTIPKITSEFSNSFSVNSLIASTVTNTVTFNGRIISENSVADNFGFVFDGLNDTYWNYEYSASAPGVASITLDIPISSGYSLSKIEGSILSEKPCAVAMKAIPADPSVMPMIKTKDSIDDYNRFSFSIPAIAYNKIQLTIYKSEPDSITRNGNNPYLYSFGLRELVIGANYYDQTAVLVSSPISIPTSDNNLLGISAVSIDVSQQILPGTQSRFYIAPDNESGKNLNDFDWIPIEPRDVKDNSEPKLVEIKKSPYQISYIDNDGSDISRDFRLIPLNNGESAALSESSNTNANELNPINLRYTNKQAYRVTQVGNATKFLQPYMLANLNCYRHYNVLNNYSKIDLQLYKSLQQWSEIISRTSDATIGRDTFNNIDSFINVYINSPSVGFLETKILCSEAKSGSHIVAKSREDFNLSVYLNGSLIADIPSGQLDAKVDWNFVKGINNIAIAYDKSFSGVFSIDLMKNNFLSSYGTIFLDYFTYLDPIEFSMKVDPSLSVFTIDEIFGAKEIIASKEISNRSMLKYFVNSSDQITSIRYRVDLNRFANPLQTPVIDAVRVKFKHNDI